MNSESISRRGLFEVGAIAAAAADISERVVQRNHNGDDVARDDPAILRGWVAVVARRS